MRITIKDIAKKAGVSHATVSRALNGHPAIPENTTARVRQIAHEMGYFPSAAARGLKTHRSQVVGVVVSQFDDPYFGDVLRGIENVLRQNNYSLFVSSFDQSGDREREVLLALGEHAVDGVLFLSIAFNSEHATQLLKFGIPWVVINNQAQEDCAYSVSHDDLEGSRQVVRHLIELGHRSIAYVGNCAAGRTNEDRLAGFTLECGGRARGIVLNCRNGEVAAGEEGARELLALAERPTAVFFFNDQMAIGGLNELSRAGLSVPADISVVGFDNIPFSALTTPPLTTFDQPKRQLGAEAAQMMLDLLAQPASSESRRQVLCGQVQVRASSAAPRLAPVM